MCLSSTIFMVFNRVMQSLFNCFFMKNSENENSSLYNVENNNFKMLIIIFPTIQHNNSLTIYKVKNLLANFFHIFSISISTFYFNYTLYFYHFRKGISFVDLPIQYLTFFNFYTVYTYIMYGRKVTNYQIVKCNLIKLSNYFKS